MEKKDQKLKRQKEIVQQPEPTMEQEQEQQDYQAEFEGQFENEEEEWVSDGQCEEDYDNYQEGKTKEAFTGNNKKLAEGQHLEVVNKAYDMLYRTSLQWPCLSVDLVVGENPFETKKIGYKEMNKYPYEIFTVQGTQGQKKNQIILAKLSKMHKTKYDDDSQDWEDQQDVDIDNDEEPEFAQATVDVGSSVNRIRTLNASSIVAYWSQSAQVCIMDLSKKYRQLKQGLKNNPKQKLTHLMFKSSNQGYSINWNPLNTGQLAAGNVNGQIMLISSDGGTNWVSDRLFSYHKGSVQDLVFSPSEKDVFATCSTDGTVQIMDMNSGKNNQSNLTIRAHSKDVNVMDWNGVDKSKILTGSDDCLVKVWDLRFIKNSNKGNSKDIDEPLCCFKWHQEPITSVAFQPNDKSMMAVASEDNRITVWDLAAENGETEGEVPNELMFIHQGQEQIKQIRYHPVYYEMLVSTASNGINVFKPCFTGGDDEEDDDKIDKPIREDELEDYIKNLNLN